MSTRALRIAVYPLLLINLALGAVMFFMTLQAILITAGVMNQGGMLANDTLGPFIYVQQSINIISLIVLALAALILFPVLDFYYARDLEQDGVLLQKFLLVLGVQLCYLGIVQLWIRAIVFAPGTFNTGATFDAGAALIIGQIILGAGMVIWARGKLKSNSRKRVQKPLKMKDDHG